VACTAVMDFIQPTTWEQALTAKAEQPDAVPIVGGTDVMVDVNFGRHGTESLLDLGRVPEARERTEDDDAVWLGAGVTYTEVIDELGDRLPGLAMASRTVGSPQIRNRGTVGGNLGSASPAGDSHPPLLTAETEVEVASVRSERRIPITEFYTGPGRHALAEDELIKGIRVVPPAGPQQFCKIGTRNAMVISVSAFAIALHPDRRDVATGIGSAAPTPRRAPEAEKYLAAALDGAGLWDTREPLPDEMCQRFGELVRSAAQPIDDVRGSAAYRAHSLAVMARRSVTWAWNDYRKAA